MIDRLILKIKRGETPLFKMIRAGAGLLLRPTAPRIPGWLKPLFRVLYELHFGIVVLARMLVTLLYRHPVFQGRCAHVGKNLGLDGLPYVSGHVEIDLGDDVWIGGNVVIASGRFVDRPRFVMKDRAEVGWNVQITANREVILEEDVRVSFDCRISDSDGHPREADLRAQNQPMDAKDIRPVRVCRYAWIGNGSHIMKGVTIGEGAIIGANSVVISDVPPYCLALGNPAEVYFRNFGKPSRKAPRGDGVGSGEGPVVPS
jgi:acetyltransferase-like isoleucine patch superfamily enzyme